MLQVITFGDAVVNHMISHKLCNMVLLKDPALHFLLATCIALEH